MSISLKGESIPKDKLLSLQNPQAYKTHFLGETIKHETYNNTISFESRLLRQLSLHDIFFIVNVSGSNLAGLLQQLSNKFPRLNMRLPACTPLIHSFDIPQLVNLATYSTTLEFLHWSKSFISQNPPQVVLFEKSFSQKKEKCYEHWPKERAHLKRLVYILNGKTLDLEASVFI